MVNRARSFIFSTAPIPVLTAALGAGLDLVDREPERRREVLRKSSLLRRALNEAGVNSAERRPDTTSCTGPIVPIVAGSNEAALALQSALMAAGFDVRAIRPPSVAPGTSRLRVTVRFPTSDDDLLRFASEVARAMDLRAA
jgi:8-amino-7-oxononanoate synthase